MKAENIRKRYHELEEQYLKVEQERDQSEDWQNIHLGLDLMEIRLQQLWVLSELSRPQVQSS